MIEDKNAWLAKVSPNLLPLSKAQDVKIASKEWAFSGKTDEIAMEIEIKIADLRRKSRRKVTAPLMEAFPDEFSQDFMFSRNNGYSALDIYSFKRCAQQIDLPMDVSDFDIACETVEDRESIMKMPKWLFEEIRGALPVKWQLELEDKFNKATTPQIQVQEAKL
jgi:hypothetical protein